MEQDFRLLVCFLKSVISKDKYEFFQRVVLAGELCSLYTLCCPMIACKALQF